MDGKATSFTPSVILQFLLHRGWSSEIFLGYTKQLSLSFNACSGYVTIPGVSCGKVLKLWVSQCNKLFWSAGMLRRPSGTHTTSRYTYVPYWLVVDYLYHWLWWSKFCAVFVSASWIEVHFTLFITGSHHWHRDQCESVVATTLSLHSLSDPCTAETSSTAFFRTLVCQKFSCTKFECRLQLCCCTGSKS